MGVFFRGEICKYLKMAKSKADSGGQAIDLAIEEIRSVLAGEREANQDRLKYAEAALRLLEREAGSVDEETPFDRVLKSLAGKGREADSEIIDLEMARRSLRG